MTVHRIRLRGRWELTAAAAVQIAPRTVRLPASCCQLFGPAVGRVRLSRRFHRPTNLGPDDQVSLIVEALPEGACVSLNGARLDSEAEHVGEREIFPATSLAPTNLLTIEFDVPAAFAVPDHSWGEVALLINSPRPT
jgi:hypothetical protein